MPSSDRVGRIEPALATFVEMLHESHTLAAHDLPEYIARHGADLGYRDVHLYLADVQQQALMPFVRASAADGAWASPLNIESTVAGRAFQLVQTVTQQHGDSGVTVWLPVLDGSERLGVLAVSAPDDIELDLATDAGRQLQLFTSIIGEIIMTKTSYGDTIVRLRRQKAMNLAAEIQWSLLPPLTFASADISIAGALEPAYEVAGDSLDYAVDHDTARFGIFDGMGHGLRSSQLVGVVVNAYRNARRAGQSLPQVMDHVEAAVSALFGGEIAYITGLVAELDTAHGRLTWISAGHPPPLLLRHGRVVKTLDVAPRVPFGLGLDATYYGTDASGDGSGSEQLEPGDYLLLYTDGVVEARDPHGDLFGVDRLADLTVKNLAAGLPASETMRRAVTALLRHQGSALTDDATMLLAQWRPGASP
jgi:Stage II sporulation protein E (SpoIIE)